MFQFIIPVVIFVILIVRRFIVLQYPLIPASSTKSVCPIAARFKPVQKKVSDVVPGIPALMLTRSECLFTSREPSPVLLDRLVKFRAKSHPVVTKLHMLSCSICDAGIYLFASIGRIVFINEESIVITQLSIAIFFNFSIN